jgi:hypothetical protein
VRRRALVDWAARIKAAFAAPSYETRSRRSRQNDLLCVSYDRESKFTLCTRIRLPVNTVLGREFLLQKSVAMGEFCIRAQHIPKGQTAAPLSPPEDQNVKVMSPASIGLAHEPTPVDQRCIRLG